MDEDKILPDESQHTEIIKDKPENTVSDFYVNPVENINHNIEILKDEVKNQTNPLPIVAHVLSTEIKKGIVMDNCAAVEAALLSTGFDGVNHNINTSTVGLNHNVNSALTGLTNQLDSVSSGLNHNINSALTGLTTQLNNGFGGQRDLDLMEKMGTVQSDVWKAEGQVQLALSHTEGALNNRIADNLTILTQGQALINKNISDSEVRLLSGQNSIRETVAHYGNANLLATKDSQFLVTTEVRNEAEKTRALLTRQYEDTLNRELAEARNALAELRTGGRVRESEINISNTNTAVAAQYQAQSQSQQQMQFLIQQNALLSTLTSEIQAVRQGQTIFNSGTMSGSGRQTASNVSI